MQDEIQQKKRIEPNSSNFAKLTTFPIFSRYFNIKIYEIYKSILSIDF